MLVHGHVRVCEYVEYNWEYCAREGILALTIFVVLIKDVYKRRIVIDAINKKMNNLVDIR
jgi:hypothetical protein